MYEVFSLMFHTSPPSAVSTMKAWKDELARATFYFGNKDERSNEDWKALITTKDSADLHTKLHEFRVYEDLPSAMHHWANHPN